MYDNDVDCVKIMGMKVIGDNSYYERAMKLNGKWSVRSYLMFRDEDTLWLNYEKYFMS